MKLRQMSRGGGGDTRVEQLPSKENDSRPADGTAPTLPGSPPMSPRSQSEFDRLVPKLSRENSVMRKKSMFQNFRQIDSTSGSGRSRRSGAKKRTIEFADDKGKSLDKTFFTDLLYYSNFYESTRPSSTAGGGGGGCCVLS